MGGGGQQTEPIEQSSVGGKAVYTWEDVQKHCSRNDKWLVINRKVYNIAQWAGRHPGGSLVISHYVGEDATEVFTAFHPDQKFSQKFLKPLLIGELAATEPSQDQNKNAAIMRDFYALRVQAEKRGLFQAKPLFFCVQLGHIILLEALAWLIVWFWGTSWIPSILSVLMLATVQVQCCWSQHDFGHLSVFKKSQWNHLMHKFIMGQLKGSSANWWNHMHFQHHAKTNVFSKDPDINLSGIFVLGTKQPVEYGIKKIRLMPYNYQHWYFFLVLPPLLLTVVFSVQTLKAMIDRHDWVDLLWYTSFYLRFFCCFVPIYGLLGSVVFLTCIRFLESHWFVWISQMNHIPMETDHDNCKDWLTMQLQATCNVEQSFFNDWFTGHLNFQIEHHLFPTMPRHNYHLIAPQVRALCMKHNIPYKKKTLWRGISDIVRSLKFSGDLWLDAYLHK